MACYRDSFTFTLRTDTNMVDTILIVPASMHLICILEMLFSNLSLDISYLFFPNFSNQIYFD
jgi:hypothetical protein